MKIKRKRKNDGLYRHIHGLHHYIWPDSLLRVWSWNALAAGIRTFFPLEVAVASTAIVHAANNAFKIGVVGKHAEKALVIRFGIPAIIAAFAGAAMLGYVSHFGEITRYSLGTREAVITPIKLSIALLMFVFALFELLPYLHGLKFDKKYLFIGGLLSGFFGGFSGHQGALRSAFLAKVGISPQAFVGTNAVIGFMVDMVRITSTSC